MSTLNSKKNQPMFGSLRLDMDEDDPVDNLKKKTMKILQYPSITKDILSLRILPDKLSSNNHELTFKMKSHGSN